MNEQQLTILTNKLEEISKDLTDAVNEKRVSIKDLMVYQTNNELLYVIEILRNHQMTKKES